MIFCLYLQAKSILFGSVLKKTLPSFIYIFKSSLIFWEGYILFLKARNFALVPWKNSLSLTSSPSGHRPKLVFKEVYQAYICSYEKEASEEGRKVEQV